MREFLDRVSGEGLSGKRKLTYDDGRVEYVSVEYADNPEQEGTPINRQIMMALQGLDSLTTVFNEDGSITETNNDGQTLTTVFNEDGSITETFVGEKTIIKHTSFNYENNVVTEAVEEVL